MFLEGGFFLQGSQFNNMQRSLASNVFRSTIVDGSHMVCMTSMGA